MKHEFLELGNSKAAEAVIGEFSANSAIAEFTKSIWRRKASELELDSEDRQVLRVKLGETLEALP